MKLRIVLTSPPSWLAAHHFDTDGAVSLDLDERARVAVTRAVDDTANVGDIKQDATRNITLPLTNKNVAVFRGAGSPQQAQGNAPVGIRVEVEGTTRAERYARVREVREDGIELELYSGANALVAALRNLKLYELDWPVTPAYDWDLFEDLHENNYTYTGSNAPYFLPVANYGKRLDPTAISLGDLRLWHSLTYMAFAALCKVGWRLVAPVLETDYARRLWCYILAPDFASRAAGANKAFTASLTIDHVIPNFALNVVPIPIAFNDDSTPPNFDNGNFYNASTGFFGPVALRADYFAAVEVDVNLTTPGAGDGFVYLMLFKRDTVSGLYTTLRVETLRFDTAGTYNMTVEATGVVTGPSEAVFVTINAINTTGVVVGNTARWYNVPEAVEITEGDLIDTGAIINRDYTAMDFLRGVVHLFNLKAELDDNTRTLYLYPEDAATLYQGDALEGFFKPNHEVKDLTNKVMAGTMVAGMETRSRKREHVLRFKEDGDDALVKALTLGDPLYANVLDFGAYYDEGQELSENPFFAPTLSKEDPSARYISASGTELDSRPVMPFLWNGEADDAGIAPPPSTKIAPRVILTTGYGKAIYGATGSTVYSNFLTSCSFMSYRPGTLSNYYAVSMYAPAHQVARPGLAIDPVSLPGPPRKYLDRECVAYSPAQYIDDLDGMYELFYRKAVSRLYRCEPLEFLLRFTAADFANLSNRDKFLVRYNSRVNGQLYFYARLVSVDDFELGGDTLTPVRLLPDEVPTVGDCCGCRVELSLTGQDATMQEFSAAVIECGEVLAVSWQIQNANTDLEFSGPTDSLDVFVTGEGNPNAWVYTLRVTVDTVCGTYSQSITLG